LKPNRASLIIRAVVWSLAGMVVALVLLLGVTAVALPGCTRCHRDPVFVEQTAKSAHPDVDCVRCHVQPGPAQQLAYAYHLIFGMGLRVAPVNSGPIAGIADTTCLSCHEPVMKQVVTVNGLSIQHADCAKGRLCTDCHSQTAHGAAVKWARTPQMNQCLDCHATTKVRSDCTMCHAERSQERRVQTGEWAVTHGPNWKKTHGMGSLPTCASCHANDFCVRCHGIPLPHNADFLRTHPVSALANPKDCSVCHKQTFCTNCHGIEMPHPAAFTPAHSTIVRAQGTAVCYRCHVPDDCTNCHAKHVHPGGATLPPGRGLQ
jgi:hypothetical protein